MFVKRHILITRYIEIFFVRKKLGSLDRVDNIQFKKITSYNIVHDF